MNRQGRVCTRHDFNRLLKNSIMTTARVVRAFRLAFNQFCEEGFRDCVATVSWFATVE